MGSSNRPSSVMEPDERTAASILGSSLAFWALKPLVKASNNMKRQNISAIYNLQGRGAVFRSWHMPRLAFLRRMSFRNER